jgi:non-specific serine/threonine protein kinase
VALAQGDHQRAVALFEENLVVCRDLTGRQRRVPYALHYLGVVALELAHLERATRLFAAAAALRERVGQPLTPTDRAEHERYLSGLRQALGRELFATAWSAGRALSIDQAIEYALSAPAKSRAAERELVGAPSMMSSSAHGVPVGSTSSPLSAREHEVAMLLTRGLSNQQIADELVISRRTASTHVTHILNKLGLSSRWEIAAWAHKHDFATQ